MLKSIQTTLNIGKLVLLSILYSMLFTACVTTNPDFSEESLLEEGELMIGGDTMAGDAMAGETMAGEAMAG